jgi:hypothetical protein
VKRTSSRPDTLKHLPFFEVLANVSEGSPKAKLATAGLLTLRMIDHWVLAGPAIVEPESVSVRSVRNAIMALPPKEPVREALLTIVNTMQMLRHVDLVPVLPRVFAYAQLLERQYEELALAADTYASVIRLADDQADSVLVMDTFQRLAFCRRRAGAIDEAATASQTLVKLATRHKDRARLLRGKLGLAHVAMMRGDLVEADSQFAAIADDAERMQLNVEYALALHNRGVVAFRSGKPVEATVLSHRALKLTSDPIDRERMLGDLAAFLIKLEQYDAAIDALRILEVTSISEEPRRVAKVNLVSVAARAGNRELFNSARRELEGVSLGVEASVNLLIESARGFGLFGDEASAVEALREAEIEAERHGLNASVQEIARLREAVTPMRAARETRAIDLSSTYEVATDLRRMASALVSAN